MVARRPMWSEMFPKVTSTSTSTTGYVEKTAVVTVGVRPHWVA